VKIIAFQLALVNYCAVKSKNKIDAKREKPWERGWLSNSTVSAPDPYINKNIA
jgi:hypothetical protein